MVFFFIGIMRKRNLNASYMMRSALKVAVDGCTLPGTMMGTELTLLYLKQWRKEYSALCFGILSLLFSMLELHRIDAAKAQFRTESEIR